MKKILILLIVLAGLIGFAVMQKNSKTKRLAVAASREKLLDKVEGADIRKIRLKDGDKSTTLAAEGDEWIVAERSNYPAAFSKISKAIQDLLDQKVGKKMTIGKSAWGDVKLESPGGTDSSKAGFTVELLGEADKPIKTMVLGSNVESSKVGESKSPFGGGGNERFVRLTDDGDTVWVVPNQFYDLKASPEDWIEKSFIDVQKMKSIEVTAPKAEDSWKASRKAEADTEYAFEGAKPDESLDNIKASLSNLLSSPTFNDVVTKDKATADFMKDAWQTKITTFEGFTYNVKAVKKGEGSTEKFYMTVDVSANLPKERPAVKDEKPEDKKKADDEFASKKKALEEHLAKDKKAAGGVYEMSSYSLGSLMRKKSDVLKTPAAGEVDKNGTTKVKGTATPVPPAMTPPSPARIPDALKAPISVTTPPVSVPEAKSPLPTMPKPEVKPAPDPKANPVTGQPSPAPAAPAAPAPKPVTPPAAAPTETPVPVAPPAADPAKK